MKPLNLLQLLAQVQKHLLAGRAGMLEGVQAFVIPAKQYLPRAALDVGHVDVADRVLADTVEPADALLEQIGVQRQVVQHQVVSELEISSFAADFRANQHLRTVVGVGWRWPGVAASSSSAPS